MTTVLPVIVPEMITIFLAVPVTAEVRAARVVTVVVVPPDPPDVLKQRSERQVAQIGKFESHPPLRVA